MICDQFENCDKTGPVGLKDTFTLWDVIGFQDWPRTDNEGFSAIMVVMS